MAKLNAHINIDVRHHITGMDTLMAQIDDLRSALADLSRESGESNDALLAAVDRIEAKITALGEPDPDLTADIQTVRDAVAAQDGFQSRLSELGADQPPAE